MAQGDTASAVVTVPINATTIKTAMDSVKTALNNTISGSYSMTSFNDGRGLAIIGHDDRAKA